MQQALDISVLIATFNRADDLRKTLEAFTLLDREGLAVEIVIVDNNSADATRQVVESFGNRLPLRYLFEPRPGKNCALNRALAEAPLGRLVVFTDDDVTPNPDWLKSIDAVSRRLPERSVFGGRVNVIWPDVEIPAWARDPYIEEIAFSRHDLRPDEGPYPDRVFPFGPNYWVRWEVLNGGRRFDESVGPRPTNRIMGSETTFLKKLADDGYPPIYTPFPVVGHRIQPFQVSAADVRRRAYRLGRQGPHVEGLCRRALLDQNPFLWSLLRVASLTRGAFEFGVAMLLLPTADPRIRRSAIALELIGYNVESLRLARSGRKNKASAPG